MGGQELFAQHAAKEKQSIVHQKQTIKPMSVRASNLKKTWNLWRLNFFNFFAQNKQVET